MPEQFDWFAYGAGVLSTLAVAAIGWVVQHNLAGRRSKAERKQDEELGKVVRAIEIFTARVDFIRANARRAPNTAELKQAYERLYWGNPQAWPDDMVNSAVWQLWKDAEAHARDRTIPIKDREKEIKDARLAVGTWLKDKREELLN